MSARTRPNLSLAIRRVVQHIMSDLARLSTYYPTCRCVYGRTDPTRTRADTPTEEDAGTVLPPTEPNPTERPCRYACGYKAYGLPDETMPTLNFFFLLTFVLTTLPTPGGPRGGDLTNGSGRAFLKGGNIELGDNGVLGGTTKNGRLLAIRSTGLGQAIWQQNCRTAHTYQPPDVRTGAVRPEFFFYRLPAALPAAERPSLLCLQLPDRPLLLRLQ
jgi:hypothetical protein